MKLIEINPNPPIIKQIKCVHFLPNFPAKNGRAKANKNVTMFSKEYVNPAKFCPSEYAFDPASQPNISFATVGV